MFFTWKKSDLIGFHLNCFSPVHFLSGKRKGLFGKKEKPTSQPAPAFCKEMCKPSFCWLSSSNLIFSTSVSFHGLLLCWPSHPPPPCYFHTSSLFCHFWPCISPSPFYLFILNFSPKYFFVLYLTTFMFSCTTKPTLRLSKHFNLIEKNKA